MSDLPLHIMESRKNEVREDEFRRKQSLAQFREWLNKHPFIKCSRIEDKHLLSFLRTRKYHMDSVFESFEKSILYYKNHSQWYDWHGEKFERAMNLYNGGIIKVLKQRDVEGRRILLVNNYVDIEKYNADDILRLGMLIFFLLSLEEETQLCGIAVVDDLSDNMSVKYLSVFSLSSFFDIAMEMKTSANRIKSVSIVGMPAFGITLFNAWKMGLSSKMKGRINIMSSRKELWNHFERTSFTTDFDGDVDERESIDDFRKIIDEKIDFARGIIDSYDVDMAKAEALNKVTANVGSFRKLEID